MVDLTFIHDSWMITLQQKLLTASRSWQGEYQTSFPGHLTQRRDQIGTVTSAFPTLDEEGSSFSSQSSQHSTGDNSEHTHQLHLCPGGILQGHKLEVLAESGDDSMKGLSGLLLQSTQDIATRCGLTRRASTKHTPTLGWALYSIGTQTSRFYYNYFLHANRLLNTQLSLTLMFLCCF